MSDLLRPAQLVAMWGVAERRARYILSELESLGATLEPDFYGARQCPAPLAEAVRDARKAGRPLDTLRLEPELKKFFQRVPDSLTELIELRAELAIQREIIGALWGAAQKGIQRPPTGISWGYLGLPDPRGKL